MRFAWVGVLVAICGHQSSLCAQDTDPGESESPGTEERLTTWQAPSSCIPIEELRSRVDAQISGELAVIREVRGEMLRGPAGWIVTLTVYESDERLGERLLELSGDECRAHDETLALVIALLLEHGPPPPPDTESAPPEPKPEKEQKRPPPVEAEEIGLAPFRLRGGVGFRATSGWLPSVAWGPSGFLGVQVFERAAVDVSGEYYLAEESAAHAGGRAKTSGGRVHLRACGLPRWGRWGLSLCSGLGWIALSAVGQGVPRSQAAFHGSMEASASGALLFELGRHFGLEAGAELVAPFRRGRFVFDSPEGAVLVHDTRPVVFGSHVGVVLTL